MIMSTTSVEEGAGVAEEKPTIAARVDPEFRDWFRKKCKKLGKSESDIIRASILLSMPQLENLRLVDRLTLDDVIYQ